MSQPQIERSSLRGWEVVTLRTEVLEIELLPGLGGTVAAVRRRSDGSELAYRTPWGLPGPATGLLGGSAEEMRTDADPGGWQSLFPNAGDNAVVDGIEWGTDGEARVTPFDVTEASPGAGVDAGGDVDSDQAAARITLTGRLRRSPFRMTKIISVSGGVLRIEESVENCGTGLVDVLWGSRLCLAESLLGAGTEIDCGAALVHPDAAALYDADYQDLTPWPRTAGAMSMINLRYLPEAGSGLNRMAYLTGFNDGWASVSSPELDCRLRLEWDSSLWPHLWYQLEDHGTTEHPWFGRERFLALTPSTGWPARGVHDARRISRDSLSLAPGETRSGVLRLRVETLSDS